MIRSNHTVSPQKSADFNSGAGKRESLFPKEAFDQWASSGISLELADKR